MKTINRERESKASRIESYLGAIFLGYIVFADYLYCSYIVATVFSMSSHFDIWIKRLLLEDCARKRSQLFVHNVRHAFVVKQAIVHSFKCLGDFRLGPIKPNRSKSGTHTEHSRSDTWMRLFHGAVILCLKQIPDSIWQIANGFALIVKLWTECPFRASIYEEMSKDVLWS